MRPSGRAPDQMRPITFTPDFTMHAEGSVLVRFGNTQVICTASVDEKVPAFRGDAPAALAEQAYRWTANSLRYAGYDLHDRGAAHAQQRGAAGCVAEEGARPTPVHENKTAVELVHAGFEEPRHDHLGAHRLDVLQIQLVVDRGEDHRVAHRGDHRYEARGKLGADGTGWWISLDAGFERGGLDEVLALHEDQIRRYGGGSGLRLFVSRAQDPAVDFP